MTPQHDETPARPTRRRAGIAAALVALLGMGVHPAAAGAQANPVWRAEWRPPKCCSQTLESGQVARNQYLIARNVGSSAWNASVVRLGTVNWPFTFPATDRVSRFAIPGNWLTSARPTPLDQASVPPGSEGRFTFDVRAPQVSRRTRFVEHFAPVAEGISWMACGGCPWDNVSLTYTVLPRAAPKVEIFTLPDSVRVGRSLNLALTATDNVGIAAVRVAMGRSLAAAERSTNSPSAFRARLSTAGLEPGVHRLTAVAIDHAGQVAVDAAPVVVYAGRIRSQPFLIGRPMGGLGFRVRSLVVREAPRGARASVRCKRGRRRACKSQRRSARRGAVRFPRMRGKLLRPGTVLAVRVTKRNHVGKYVRYRIGRDGVPRRGRPRCMAPGSSKPKRRCPSTG